MPKVTIQTHTTKHPLQLIGEEAGVCWGADTSDKKKNYNRGLECLQNNHGRTLEYPQVYIVLEGFSARVIREFYTHIGGLPTRLQASTRYIDYGKFNYIIPSSIENNVEALHAYESLMANISDTFIYLQDLNIPKEDIANILPLGMETKVVVRLDLRELIEMSHQRLCGRAYWEFRLLMKLLMEELCKYSLEWEYIVKHYFKPKCQVLGRCPEKYSCKKV
jgi:thymidylate synthase (FAD)